MRKGVLVLFALLLLFAAPASFAVCLTCNFETCNCERGFSGSPRCSPDFPCCGTFGSCFAPPRPIAGEWTVASVEVTRPSAVPVRSAQQQKLARAATTAPVSHTR